MEYKGYLASVEFDDSADVLHGRVVNSGPYPTATFEATETRELRREFERSVDEYLKWCEEDGVEPRKPFSGKLNVRLGSELHSLCRDGSQGGASEHQFVDRHKFFERRSRCHRAAPGGRGRRRSGRHHPDTIVFFDACIGHDRLRLDTLPHPVTSSDSWSFEQYDDPPHLLLHPNGISR